MLKRHPFLKSLIQFVTRITAGWFTVIFCIIGSFIVIGLIGAILGSGSGPSSIAARQHVYGAAGSSHKLLSIRVTGVLEGQAPDDSSQRDPTAAYGYDIKKQLYDATKDSQIEGVVLEIDSPGGAIYGAQAIADGVAYYKDQTHRPVFAHVSGLAASGAYWAAVSTDRIIADTGSSLGSIGVIEGPFKYYDKVLGEDDGTGSVVTQNGISSTIISAGTGKTEGDPYQRLTAAEIANLQLGVNNDYTVFVNYVSDRRHIPAATIRDSIGAMIYDNQTAITDKLIDATGSREDAYIALAKAANVPSDDYEVVRANAPGTGGSLGDLAAQTRAKLFPRQAATPLCNTPGVKAYYGDPSALCAQ